MNKYQQYLDDTEEDRIETHSEYCWKWHHRCAIARAARAEDRISELEAQVAALTERLSVPPENNSEPVAWIIPGDDQANANGFIDARIWKEGEFTRPLYAHPASPDPVANALQAMAPTRDDITRIIYAYEGAIREAEDDPDNGKEALDTARADLLALLQNAKRWADATPESQ